MYIQPRTNSTIQDSTSNVVESLLVLELCHGDIIALLNKYLTFQKPKERFFRYTYIIDLCYIVHLHYENSSPLINIRKQ